MRWRLSVLLTLLTVALVLSVPSVCGESEACVWQVAEEFPMATVSTETVVAQAMQDAGLEEFLVPLINLEFTEDELERGAHGQWDGLYNRMVIFTPRIEDKSSLYQVVYHESLHASVTFCLNSVELDWNDEEVIDLRDQLSEYYSEESLDEETWVYCSIMQKMRSGDWPNFR